MTQGNRLEQGRYDREAGLRIRRSLAIGGVLLNLTMAGVNAAFAFDYVDDWHSSKSFDDLYDMAHGALSLSHLVTAGALGFIYYRYRKLSVTR